MSEVQIRQLGPQDWEVLRDLRLEGLRLAPAAFGMTLEAALALSEADWRRIAAKPVFAAFAGEVPAALAGVIPDEAPSHRHRAVLAMVFVRPEFRGLRLTDRLIEAGCDWCRTAGILQLELVVTPENTAARRVYERCGFEIYGLLPRGRQIRGVFVDDLLMIRRLG